MHDNDNNTATFILYSPASPQCPTARAQDKLCLDPWYVLLLVKKLY